jgi:ribosome recycling factor
MPIKELIKDCDHRMKGAIDALHRDFKTLRTGRASTSMLDGITVDYYGTPTPLSQVANLTVPESTLLVAQPWDKSMIPVIERAILTADLGLNPANDGKVVRIPVPALNEERRKELVKRAHTMAEDVRTAIRQVRRDINDKLKKIEKEHEISQDDEHRALDDVQKMTDKFIEEVNQALKHKEQEIMEV